MSSTYCKLPFLHLYSQADGEVKPCCIAGGFDEALNLQKMSIENAFNSPQMKNLRKDMLEGKRNKACDICYKREDSTGHSPRIDFNKNSLWVQPEVADDFSVPSDFQHIDIRFSNLCNFKCRMCNHDFSSNWYEDYKKLHPFNNLDKKTKVIRASETIVEDLIPHLSNIKSFYFAGGEPLIMPEHFKVLKHLHENMKIHTMFWKGETKELRKLSIHYNTNLSVIKYDEQSLIDLWRGFERVYLSISCDGIGKVGEYQRTGFNTKRFESNLEIIKKYAEPKTPFEIGQGIMYGFQYTTTIMNVYHIFDFIEYMLKKEHIKTSEHIDFYYAWSPAEFSLAEISQVEKDKIKIFLNKSKKKYPQKTQNEIDAMIDYMESYEKFDESTVSTDWRTKHIRKIEELHGGKFEDISPVKIEGKKSI
tara:strand:+ start:586 stop:1842 length:1257 start_codon:yes stop_codon:yes gene_type:complete